MAATAALFALGAAHAGAQSAPSPTPAVAMWGPSEPGSMTRVGNTLYVGGGFNYVGPPTGSFAIVDAADATQVNTAARLLEGTKAVVSDGAGGWFALGYPFGNNANRVRHILPSGAVDAAWTAPVATGGNVDWLVRDGTRLFMAGFFTQVGGTARAGIAALDASTGTLLPWNANLNVPSVISLFIDSGVVYIHGGFSAAGGVPRTGTAALDAVSGAALPFASVGAEAASGHRLYSQCVNPANSGFSVCAYDRAGVTLPTWVVPVFNGTESPRAVVADASRVFVLTFDGLNLSRIRAFDPLTGASLPSWTGPAFTNNVSTMTLDGGTLFVGGTFTAVNGQLRTGLAALDAATGVLTNWAPAVGGISASIAVAQGRVAIGGPFASAGGIARRFLAALDLTTGLPLSAAPSVSRPVTAIGASDDLVVAAEGDFTSGEVFGFSAATGVKYPVTLPYTGQVTALEISGARLFIGGHFAFGSEPARSLAVFDLAGGGLLPWNPVLGPFPNPINPSQPFPPRVNVISARLGRLYVGGFFTSANGISRGNGAAFDLATLGLTDWDPRLDSVYGLEIWQGRVLVSGGGAVPGNSLLRLRWVDPGSGDRLNLPHPEAPFSTNALTIAGGTLIVAGARDSLSPPGPTVVALDPATGRQLPWNPGLGTGVQRALGFDDLVVLSGGITTVGQEPAANLVVFRTTPPAPPRNLTFDNGAPAVTLAWTAAAGATPASYVIEAGTAPGLGDLGRFPVGSRTHVSAAVGSGTYALRVFAVGLTGTSAASSEIVFTRPAPSVAPTAPAGLTGSVSAGVVFLTWAPVVDATSYVIEGGSAAGLVDLGVLPTGVLDTNIAGALPAATYFLRVRAANRFGLSPVSNEVQVVVP